MAVDAQFKLKTKEWDRVLKKVRKKWKDIKNRKEFAGIISANVFRDITAHFEDEQGSKGPWRDWSTQYAKHMKKIGKGENLILQDSGKLKGSLEPLKGKFRTNSSGVIFFTRAKTKDGFAYAALHNKGGKFHPKRDFMWLSSEGRIMITQQTEKWLKEGL